ncbi:MAG: 6-carboxytetrahydropterin synthase QueD [Nitrospirota bacterium]
MYELRVENYFSGAHQLRNYNGKCENLHGHNWKVEVYVDAYLLNEIGIGVDFKILKKEIKGLLEEVDHKFLNDIFPFTEINPSAENIARWMFNSLSKKINNNDIHVSKVVVWESNSQSAAYSEKIERMEGGN